MCVVPCRYGIEDTYYVPPNGGTFGKVCCTFLEAWATVLAHYRRFGIAEGDANPVHGHFHAQLLAKNGGSLAVADRGLEARGQRFSRFVQRNLAELDLT